MKRGMNNQIFYYIFAIVIIVFILTFGSDTIGKLFGFGKDVETEKFTTDLNEKIGLIHNLNSGSVISLYDLNVPDGVTLVCFESGGFKVNNKFRKVDYLEVQESFCVRDLEDTVLRKEGRKVRVTNNGPTI